MADQPHLVHDPPAGPLRHPLRRLPGVVRQRRRQQRHLQLRGQELALQPTDQIRRGQSAGATAEAVLCGDRVGLLVE
ncbi:hypothetical protein D3C85_1754200 [compost metagenome]